MRRALPLLLALGAGAAAAQAPRDWNFTVLLDGQPVGEHRFAVQGPPQQREVESRARMDVRLFGVFTYRYRHEATERWQGDCLRELRSATEDGGSQSTVDQRPAGECLMGFAYWHPNLATQTRLLNPQTGQVEAVRFERLPTGPVEVRGQVIDALGWRLLTPKQSVNIWYARTDGAWIGLDAEVTGGRRLAYRLR